MADLSHYDRLRNAFDVLLNDLAATWPANDLDYVREEVDYGEYGDALENLIALGLRNHRPFDSEQVMHIEDLATAMGMDDSPFLAQLRESSPAASGPALR
jgi:hypothetical protein